MSKRRTAAALSVVVGALAVAGCEHHYVYQPTVATTSAIAGHLASYYAIPAEAPRGSVQLATFGLADIHPTGAADGELRAIHVRMVVSNNDVTPWRIDTREQLLTLPDHGQSRPAYAGSDAGQGPIIEVPSKSKRTIDLFYPLPEHMQEASDLPAFDTLWKVETSARVVTDRTPFERLEVVPHYDYYDYYYWGPAYGYYPYYDPYYVHGGAFVGVHVAPGYGHGYVVVHPSHGGPHGHHH